MTLSIDELRNAFSKSERQHSLPNNYYPFWKMQQDQRAVLRFLPDADENNPMGFVVEKLTHALEVDGKYKTVPCGRMNNEPCPICKLSKSYYDQDDKENGKKYWKKTQHVAQALVMEDPLPADEDGNTHVGKVRLVALSKQVYDVIKNELGSGDFDAVPYAYEGGTDFIIKKTKQGQYDNYSVGSKFSRKSTDLDPEVVDELELMDLKSVLPKPMTTQQLEEVLQASLTGTDVESLEEDETPFKAEKPKPKKKAAPAPAPVAEDDDEDPDVEAVLAQIRSRRAG